MLRFLTAGESHGPELVVIVEGMPAGLEVHPERIDDELVRRQQGYGRGARSTKIERDRALIVSGIAGGRTTGAPVAMRIVNKDFANQPDHPKRLTAPRPGHADLAGRWKYGLEDFRLVRERASARETAARVAAGAMALELLAAFGVRLGSFVTHVGDAGFDVSLPSLNAGELLALAEAADGDPIRSPDPAASQRMRAAVDDAKARGETLGGVFVVFATGAPPGLGSHVHWDRKLDGRLAQAICSIHAVKGVEVGAAFEVAAQPGTEVQDAIVREDGRLVRRTNFAGGLEGGMTNGEPIVLRAAMKPLSSVRAELASVDFTTGETVDPPYVRSDVCAVPAAAVVGEAMVAWVLAGAIAERFGGDRIDAMLASRDAVAEAESRAVPAAAAGSVDASAGSPDESPLDRDGAGETAGAVEEEIDG
jgi:chorismate synthase